MLESVDLWLLRAVFVGASGRAWLDAMLLFTFLGSGWILFGVIPLLFLRSTRTTSAALLLTTAATSALVALVKVLIGRERPFHAFAWVQPLAGVPPLDPSFPSGHAAGSFAFATFIFASHRRAGVGLLGVATAIAFSRVALGVHYPTDVGAGALLGATIGAIGARLNARFTAPESATVPAISPAVGLTDTDSESVGK